MKFNKFGKVLTSFALVSACAFGAVALTGCGSDSGELKSDTGLTGGVAATVNDVEIPEDSVTRAINNIRISYGYTEDDTWKQFLKSGNYTVESMRYTLLDGFIEEELVKQCADQLGLSVTDEEIDEAVESVSSKYSTQDAWEKAVEEVGYENGIEGYRDSLKYSILKTKIDEIYSEEAQKEMKSNKNVLSAINESISQYDGAKKSSLILFSSADEELAKTVRKQIASGELTFADAAKKYSTDTSTKDKGGDMGWDKLNQFDEEYTTILNDLKKEGQLSKVTSTDNGWAIVQFSEVYDAPKKVNRISSVPEDFVTDIKTTETQSRTQDKYDDWIETVKSQQNVVVNPMPENVPYWVDLSGEYTEEEMKKINDEAYADLVGEVAAEETEDDAVEDDAKEGEGASGDQASEGDSSETSDEGGQSEGESTGEEDAQADAADSGE